MFLTKSKMATKTNQRGGNLVVKTVSRAANYGLHGLLLKLPTNNSDTLDVASDHPLKIRYAM